MVNLFFYRCRLAVLVTCLLCLLALNPVLAQTVGGLDRSYQATWADTLQALLTWIVRGGMTLVFIWAVYQFLFQRADAAELLRWAASVVVIGVVYERVRQFLTS